MKPNPNLGDTGPEPALAEGRKDLARRLDDLRGLGLLPAWSETIHVRGEDSLQRLALSLIDLLESAQRRVIETSIQLLSLRELISGLLNMRTPDTVARTVSLYLHKAFDHERVLVGVYDAERDAVRGWIAVRRGSPRFSEFVLEGEWGGALREGLTRAESIRSWQDDTLTPLVTGDHLPDALDPFRQQAVGPYVVYPLLGSQEGRGVLGVLAVARGFGSPTLDGMEAEILQSLVESVATALENVILDEEVRRQEAFRKDIMGSMGSGLIAIDLAGRVLSLNRKAEQLTGFLQADIQDATTDRLDPHGDGVAGMLRETLESRRDQPRRETLIRTADGRMFPVAALTTLLRNPKGDVYGAIVIFEDLSQLKAMEERIRQLDRLAALGRFTAGVAHEIRNPLGGIAAGIQYLSRHLQDQPDQLENIDFMQREITRLNRIVEDLFQVTHPSPPRRTPEKARGLADMAVRCLGPEGDRVSIDVHVAEDLPRVPVDPDQIQQVLLNLIKNAAEASPEGGSVRVDASLRAGIRELEIRVRDHGPGIPAESLPHVFEPFFTEGKAGGTGLGLYVSHGIVERHGGELLAANAEGGGAEFTLRLPLVSFDTLEISE